MGQLRLETQDHIESRAAWPLVLLLIGGTGFFVTVFSVALLNPPRNPTPLWVFWGVSVVFLFLAIAEAILLKIVITKTTFTVRHVLSYQSVPLAELRSIQRVKGDYIVKKSRGMWILFPSFITNQDAVIERLQRAIAANMMDEVPGMTEAQRKLVKDAIRAGSRSSP